MDFVTGSCETKDMEFSDLIQAEDNSVVKTHGMIYSIKDMGDFGFLTLRKRDGLVQCVFDKGKLEKAVASLPEQYTLSMIDERLYQMCMSETWSRDLVSQFPDYEVYRNLGIGAVICKNGMIVSGASSYSRYKEGIEVEIDTKEEYRRKGLAYVCGVKLILECLNRNLYPSWDAHNKGSAALAEKLGYHYSHTYTAIEIYDY